MEAIQCFTPPKCGTSGWLMIRIDASAFIPTNSSPEDGRQAVNRRVKPRAVRAPSARRPP
jgi:hypothetical protein